MDCLMVKLANGINWMSLQAKKLFANFTNDQYFYDYLENGSGSTWYLSIFGLIFLYKGALCAYLLSQQDELSSRVNIALFNTVWLDGLDRTVNLAGLLFSINGTFLLWFSPKDSNIRQLISGILATGSVNQIKFFQFKSNGNKSATQQEAHAKLNRYAALHRISFRFVFTLLNVHNVYLEVYVISNMKPFYTNVLTNVFELLLCQFNCLVFVVVTNVFLRFATRNIFLTLIFIRAITLKQRIPSIYFRHVHDNHLKAETVEAYFVYLHQLLLPLKQASAYLGMSLFVSIAAHLPSNALCITMALILPMSLPARFVFSSFAAIQLAVSGVSIYMAASVNGAVHGPSVHLLSAHFRNQRRNAHADFETRLFRWQQGNAKDRKIQCLLHAERHFEQFILNCKRRYTNQYGLAFGTLGCITLLSASKALFIYVKFMAFYFKRFLNF